MTTSETPEDFKRLVNRIKERGGYVRPRAFGVGIAHLNTSGVMLDTWFPVVNYEENFGTAAIIAHVLNDYTGVGSVAVTEAQLAEILRHFRCFKGDGKKHANIEALESLMRISLRSRTKSLVASVVPPAQYDEGPRDISDAYLRLHLLSHRKVKPHGIKLDNIFGKLPNVAWTSEGPVDLEDLAERKVAAQADGRFLTVHSVDKFPRMTDYVVPSGVRIADADRVRLGAYLGEGTTVMHEGFVNFNAGTLGKSMVEGRISAGVVVGDQSDIGGGASIMGTLSGGGKEVIVVGRGCLIGANAGTGISLGDRCVVEAGLYVTAGMPVKYQGNTVKAAILSGESELTFRRNGKTGVVEAIHKPNKVVLNEILHKN